MRQSCLIAFEKKVVNCLNSALYVCNTFILLLYRPAWVSVVEAWYLKDSYKHTDSFKVWIFGSLQSHMLRTWAPAYGILRIWWEP